jgi:AraC-like DNA-binding protein
MKRIKHLEEVIYNHAKEPLVEVWEAPRPINELTAGENLVAFVISGKIRILEDSGEDQEGLKGTFIFIPSGRTVILSVSSSLKLLIVRIDSVLHFYTILSPDRLYEGVKTRTDRERLRLMHGNDRVRHYIQEMVLYVEDERSTIGLFRNKIEELFLLLNNYYELPELCDIFLPILTPDLAFSEYVRHNHDRYRTPEELAASLNISVRSFVEYFRYTFGMTPYRWMLLGKIRKIKWEIMHTSKTNQEIAEENGFLSTTQFYDFCKDQIGFTPNDLRNQIR